MACTSFSTMAHDILLEDIEKHIQSLEEKYKLIEQEEESLSQSEPLNEIYQELQGRKLQVRFCLEELQKLQKSSAPRSHAQLSSTPRLVNANRSASTADVCPFQKWSSSNENPCKEIIKPVELWDKGRYLCISDGFVIHCLDLKLGKDKSKHYGSGMQPIPTLSTLNLLKKDLPVSMGLLKYRSMTYMISGQEFPGFEKHPSLKAPRWLYKKYGLKGSSRKAYHLCLEEGGLSLFECNNIPPLKKAKFWSIVERIDDQIHVIESIPEYFDCPDTLPSHEVLSLNDLDGGWKKLSPMCYPEDVKRGMFIDDYLMVGDRIYATANEFPGKIFIFDFKTKKWESPDHGVRSTNHVTSAFGFGNGMCAGKLMESGSEGPWYVGIGIENTRKGRDDANTKIGAFAHLITAMGQVLCSQALPHFFEGLKLPSYMLKARVFHVNEQENTMCAVVLAKDMDHHINDEDEDVDDKEEARLDYLYICTFTLKEVASKPRPPVSSLWTHNDKDVEPPYQGPTDFVNVVVKDRHVYRVGTDLWAEGHIYFPPSRLSAWFL